MILQQFFFKHKIKLGLYKWQFARMFNFVSQVFPQSLANFANFRVDCHTWNSHFFPIGKGRKTVTVAIIYLVFVKVSQPV